ncbi:CS1 type fimbrial major subunit [Pseudomonas sp. FP1740]|uniref:CS1 type fimbrial major subunit n=1 Tax=Pseudomonas sp. FP1740 TaxID=2954078 RepID=UPI0027366945|nr:CS1 type fimbrial major subunit [Pseudomonas sp. FP1740]WLG46034.1 CS1 type fimbrial major subunit [Pseudomonas sp. FP1740]
MFKKFAIAVPMTLLALSSSVAFAAEESRTSINITADIPSKVFHAQPVNPDFGKDERMQYIVGAGDLSEIRGTFDIQHTNGSVGAYVVGGPTPLFNGNSALNIPLTYTFNGTVLTADSQEVVGDVESNGGMRADLVIKAAKPNNNQVGVYTANPVVMFDAIPRI